MKELVSHLRKQRGCSGIKNADVQVQIERLRAHDRRLMIHWYGLYSRPQASNNALRNMFGGTTRTLIRRHDRIIRDMVKGYRRSLRSARHPRLGKSLLSQTAVVALCADLLNHGITIAEDVLQGLCGQLTHRERAHLNLWYGIRRREGEAISATRFAANHKRVMGRVICICTRNSVSLPITINQKPPVIRRAPMAAMAGY